MSENESKKSRSQKLFIQPRDVVVFKFLDRVGYANLVQISRAAGTDGGEKAQAAVLRRLYLLRRFGYIRTFSTHQGNYYGLETKSKMDNELISSIKLDQIKHHDFLIDLLFVVQGEPDVLSEREVIAKFKVVGKKGKIPDMVINDWVIEYERTNKSVVDSQSVVKYWTEEQGKKLCIIYETEEIKNRYTALLNPRVRLLARSNYADILHVLAADTQHVATIVAPVASPVHNTPPVPAADSVSQDYAESIKNKYM